MFERTLIAIAVLGVAVALCGAFIAFLQDGLDLYFETIRNSDDENRP